MQLLIRLLLLVIGAAALAGPAAAQNVLIFSHSTGYRHTAIEPGVVAIKALGEKAGYTVTTSEDPAVFSTESLKNIDAIVFVSTTTKPDDPASEWLAGARGEALQAFVHRGGGIVGVHAAADSHYHWPWFGKLMGARFVSHPQGTPEGVVTVVDDKHPSTKGLTKTVKRADEWYYYQDYDPRLHVLVTVDPESIGQKDVNPNPISWSHEFEGARVFYTGLGHTAESYQEPWFLQHLGQGLEWVLKK